jgi:quercetin dioxygenase-like cupin family protein
VAQARPITESGPFELAPGVRMFPLFGDGAMLMLVELEPGAVVPSHSHPHEQLGLVLSGTITFDIGGAKHELGPDGAYRVPGGVEHGAVAGPAGCRVVDIFQPVREDYRTLAEGESRG